MTADSLRELATRTLLARFADMCEGAVIVDAEARVVWMNERYPARLGIADPAAAIGLPIEQVIPNSLMRQVITSGRPIMLDIMDFGDESFVVNRLPCAMMRGQSSAPSALCFTMTRAIWRRFFHAISNSVPIWPRPNANWPRRAVQNTVFPVLSGPASPPAKSRTWPDGRHGRRPPC